MTSPQQTTLTRLREQLDAIERQFVVMDETRDGAYEVLQTYTAIEVLLEEAQQARFDVAPEANRADFMERQLIGKAQMIVGLVERAERAGDLATTPIWQTLVTTLAATRRKRIRGLMTGGAVVVSILAMLFVVLPAIFPVTPAADTSAVFRLAGDGDYAGALARAQAEQEVFPDDPDLAVWIAALEQRLDTPDVAARWEEAQALYPDDASFYFTRANTLLQLGMPDAAEPDGQRLVALPEAEVYGHLILGGVAEQRGDAATAVTEFQRAADLAEELGDPQLQVMARVRLGMAMQSAPMFMTPTPTP